MPDEPGGRQHSLPTTDRDATFSQLVRSDLLRYRPEAATTWFQYLLRAPFHPGLLCGLILRANQRLFLRGHQRAAYLMRTLGATLFSIDMVPGAVIGERLYLPHPAGVVLACATIGHDVTILQGSTVAGAVYADGRLPQRGTTVGDGAAISANVMILDGLTIGARVEIGANSVVLHDMPDDALVVGAPAREIPRKPTPAG